MQQVTTFLMFTGQAEAALTLYTSVFANSRILSLTRYGAGEDGAEGTVKHATFSLNGQEFMAIDSSPVHAFTFTPSISLFVTCADEAEIDRVYAALAEGGGVMMPLGECPFARKFAWIADRFGVSWQLSLALQFSASADSPITR